MVLIIHKWNIYSFWRVIIWLWGWTPFCGILKNTKKGLSKKDWWFSMQKEIKWITCFYCGNRENNAVLLKSEKLIHIIYFNDKPLGDNNQIKAIVPFKSHFTDWPFCSFPPNLCFNQKWDAQNINCWYLKQVSCY